MPLALQAAPSQFRADPSRPGSDEPPTILPLAEIVPPVVAVRRLDAIDTDVLAVFSSGSWLSVDLDIGRGRRQWYRISPAEYFSLPGRIVVAPTPRHRRAVLELLAIEPTSGEVTSLGRPMAGDASWRLELSDLRERDGRLEALLIAHDSSPLPEAEAPVHGALVRLDGGAWKHVGDVPLPAGADARSLRFDAVDPHLLLFVATDDDDGHESAWSRKLP